jgi:hypothetical protein
MPLSPSQPQEELHPKGKEVGILVLDAFAKLQKATQLRVFLAVRIEELDRFLLNLIFGYF